MARPRKKKIQESKKVLTNETQPTVSDDGILLLDQSVLKNMQVEVKAKESEPVVEVVKEEEPEVVKETTQPEVQQPEPIKEPEPTPQPEPQAQVTKEPEATPQVTPQPVPEPERNVFGLGKYYNYFKKLGEEDFVPIQDVSENAQKLLEKRYFISMHNKQGGLIFQETTYDQLCRRVSRCLAAAEVSYTRNAERIKLIEYNIYEDMLHKRMLFNSPVLFNAGKGVCNDPDRYVVWDLVYNKELKDMTYNDYLKINSYKNPRQMGFACFVIGFEDNLESIMDCMKDGSLISKAGGGIGVNFSTARERGSAIHGGIGGTASGPVSWLRMYNGMADAVVQGGHRRAACMGMLNVDHPDLYEFLYAKDEEGVLDKFNLSVALTDKFMQDVLTDKGIKHEFISRKDNKPLKGKFPIGFDDEGNIITTDEPISVGKVWDDISEHAWKRGDPGLYFIDRANYDNILKKSDDWKIVGTNPCVTGDTLIAVADGRKPLSIKQLAEEGKDVEVYCQDENNEIQVRYMRNIRKTRENAEILKFTFEDGDSLRCTPNHKLYTSGNIKKEAKDFKVGDSIIVSYKDLDEWENYLYTITSIEKCDNEDVYNGTVDDFHNYMIYSTTMSDNISRYIKSANCGEQGLMRNTSCNLGSINFNSFIKYTDEGMEFDIEQLIYQIFRSMYYLDLVLDFSSFPLPIIKEKSLQIRPVGLGFMGLADLAYRFGLSYKNPLFVKFCDIFAQLFGIMSISATVQLTSEVHKDAFPVHSIVSDLFKNCKITDFNNYEHIREEFIKNDIPYTTRNAFCNLKNNGVDVLIKETLFGNDETKFNEWYKHILINFMNGNFRNSRRLTIAPTGSISMILDASSGIEPLFALGWGRTVFNSSTVDKNNDVYQYTYHYLTKEEKELLNKGELVGGKYLCANDLSPEDHIAVMDKFAQIIDSSISKCLAKGTKIPTNQGFINIEDFSDNRNEDTFKDISDKNIMVKDEFGNWKKVLSHYCGGRKKTIKLVTNENDEIECSENHKFKTDKGWKKASELTKDDTIAVRISSYLDGYINKELPIEPITTSDSKYDLPTNMNKRLAIFLGLLCVYGSIDDQDIVCFRSRYESDIKDYIKLFRKIFGDQIGIAASKTNVYFRDKQIASWLRKLIYTDNNEVKVPDQILNGSKIEQLAFIYGAVTCGERIIDADYDIEDNDFDSYSFAYHFYDGYSKPLRDGIYLISRNIGFHTYKTENKDDKGNLCYRIKFVYDLNEDFRNYFVGIKELTYSENDVFDIEVEDTHTYLVNGLVTHNTINLPNNATVEDVQNIYVNAYNRGFKGVTIYRDGSRNTQPINRNDNKKQIEEVKEEVVEQVTNVIKTNIDNYELQTTDFKRPLFSRGVTVMTDVPSVGKLYLTINFDINNKPFEAWIRLGKSGTIITSLIDALSRVISIGLQKGVPIEEFIHTMVGMTTSEAWVFETATEDEILLLSIPDAVAKLTVEILKNQQTNNIAIINNTANNEENKIDIDEDILHEVQQLSSNLTCPECGSQCVLADGCMKCINPGCGWSPCGIH